MNPATFAIVSARQFPSNRICSIPFEMPPTKFTRAAPLPTIHLRFLEASAPQCRIASIHPHRNMLNIRPRDAVSDTGLDVQVAPGNSPPKALGH